MPRTPFIGGNWKMNTNERSARALAAAVRERCGDSTAAADVAIFPPFPYLTAVHEVIAGSSILLGAQDVYHESDGAFTGEISADMLVDIGCDAVIIGHSERRHVIGEDDDLMNAKTRAALDRSLWVALCIGEKLEEREAGLTDEVNLRQLRAGLQGVPVEQAARQVIIAYEPVWAIGTGRTASPEDAQQAHRVIRDELARLYDQATADVVRIIYGGSVKAKNAAELFQQLHIDGFLVGGASLDSDEFAAIVARCVGTGADVRARPA